MAARTATNPKKLANSQGGKAGLRVQDCLIRGTVTYKAGEFLRMCSDGLVEESTTSGHSGVNQDAFQYYALADLAAAIGDDLTTKRLGIVHEDDLWEINEKSTTIARANIGQHYGMDRTSNICTLDSTNTTHVVFEVVNPTWAEQPFQNSSADTKALLVVKVLATTIHSALYATDI